MKSILGFFAEISEELIEQLEQLTNVDVSFGMALVDSLPVIVFMIGMGFVIKIAYGRVNPVIFALLSGGVFTSFFGGALKCTWKFCAAFGYNYTPLTVSFTIYQAIGFALIALSLILLVIADKKTISGQQKPVEKIGASAVFVLLLLVPIVKTQLKAGFIWFIIMALFTTVYLICLAILAFRRKMIWQGILFFVSMILMFVMAGLGNKFDDPASPFAKLNWIAQIVNTLVQACMALPAYLLSKKFVMYRTEYVPEA